MAQAEGGYRVLLPTVAAEDMTISAIVTHMLPWNAVRVLGLVGKTTASSEPVLTISMEWPIIWLRTADPLPKLELEWLYLRRFSGDQALATGSHAFGDVQPGNDPPDATVQTDFGRLGVESTSLTFEGRRGANALFLRLRRRVQMTEPAAFSKLAGNVIYVWFQESDVPALGWPHRASDDAAIDALLQTLAEYTPKPEDLWQPTGPFPEQAPPLPLAGTEAGAKFYAVPITGAVPSTVLFSVAGFELGLAYTTHIRAEGAWDEVQRLVDSHDKPGVDLLLITAGGPDANGNLFPSEEVLAGFVVEHPRELKRRPDHIRSVVLHSWGTGRATALHPAVEPLFGPIYDGMTPIHHKKSLLPRPTSRLSRRHRRSRLA